MPRIEKATRYINKHKAKKCIIEAKKKILSELETMPNCNKIISGSTYGFIKAVTNRFKACFFAQEYMDILTGLTPDYTDRQIKFYDGIKRAHKLSKS